MCFSADASFVAAGATAAAGLFALTRTNGWREWPLAAIPLIFAFQQAMEGLLWLRLAETPDGSTAAAPALLFLLLAEVFWPVYAPLAVLPIEPSPRRRMLMRACLAAGIGVAAYLLWLLATRPFAAAIVEGHIVYAMEYRHSDAIGAFYLAATGLPLVLSSRRTVVALGAVILIGSATAYAFYRVSFVSVWCFFAAAASVVLVAHFAWARNRRLRMAGA